MSASAVEGAGLVPGRFFEIRPKIACARCYSLFNFCHISVLITMMLTVAERGKVPATIVEALRARGITITRTASAGCPLVICAPGHRRRSWPKTPHAAWIWLTPREVPAAQRIDAVLAGAYDVISLQAPDAGETLAARLAELAESPPPPPAAPALVTESGASRQIVAQVAGVAPTSMSVLFTGETGTGKEVMARLLHAWSARQKKPFIPINCAAIPNELMEAELFGYARGAFSGAVQRYDGQLMAAEGGTVFLDEIDETPPETQVKLLRVLEDRVVNRLGENVWREVDFRLLAATNRDLRTLIDAGLFGADLYERLAIVTIHLMPLRERLEDLPHLAQQFMARFAREQNRAAVTGIRRDALAALAAYPWPGNIRELRNVVYETLVYKRAGTEIIPSDLPRRILERGAAIAGDATVDRTAVARKIERGTMNLKEEVAALERLAIDEALKRAGGNAAQAARLLGQVGRGVSRDPGGTVRAMLRRLKDPIRPR
jgi:DNA-binding NtrC family response regulator